MRGMFRGWRERGRGRWFGDLLWGCGDSQIRLSEMGFFGSMSFGNSLRWPVPESARWAIL